MLRKTTTILAVALTVSACGGTIESSESDPTEAQLPGGQVGLDEEPDSTDAKPPGGQVECDMDALNEQLSFTVLDDAIADHERFRCLCDDEGYPLVGNINGKVIATASELCSALREQDLL
jgi:hypothetical protein